MGGKYFTYIARCSDNSLYTGITSNVVNREKRHNNGQGCEYTKKRLPIKIEYFETYNTLKEAASREKQIKGWVNNKKERLIKGKQPILKK